MTISAKARGLAVVVLTCSTSDENCRQGLIWKGVNEVQLRGEFETLKAAIRR